MRLQSMINAVDLHCCGEPGRVIVGGVRDVPGKSMFEKMRYLETEADDLRKRSTKTSITRDRSARCSPADWCARQRSAKRKR